MTCPPDPPVANTQWDIVSQFIRRTLSNRWSNHFRCALKWEYRTKESGGFAVAWA